MIFATCSRNPIPLISILILIVALLHFIEQLFDKFKDILHALPVPETDPLTDGRNQFDASLVVDFNKFLLVPILDGLADLL